jgi:hypothetical protein
MLRQPNGPARPDTPGSKFSSGTKASSNTTSPVTEVRSEILPSTFGVEKPLVPRSTMKPRIFPSSFAQTMQRSAIGAFEIHILAPFSLKPFGAFSARVLIEPGSEPKSGSVRPKQPTNSALASLGRYLRFCASLP